LDDLKLLLGADEEYAFGLSS